MAGKEGGLADLSLQQKALIVAIVVAAVAGVLYFGQQYRAHQDTSQKEDARVLSDKEKLDVLTQLEATRENDPPSEEEKMKILERLQTPQ